MGLGPHHEAGLRPTRPMNPQLGGVRRTGPKHSLKILKEGGLGQEESINRRDHRGSIADLSIGACGGDHYIGVQIFSTLQVVFFLK